MKNQETKKALIIGHTYHELLMKHRRRYDNQPYWWHPQRVAKLVHRSGLQDDHAIACALLHDTVEDTKLTIKDVETLFNRRIAHIVSLLSDTPMPSVNRRDRKRFSLLRMRDCPPYLAETVHTIKLADLYDNAKSIIKFDQKFAKTYMYEYAELFDALTKAKPTLRALCEKQLLEYIAHIDQPTPEETIL